MEKFDKTNKKGWYQTVSDTVNGEIKKYLCY